MHRGMDWLRLKAGEEGLTMGLGGGDVSKEENKGQEGLTSGQKRRKPSRRGSDSHAPLETEVVDDGGRWWGVVEKMVGVVGVRT